MKDNPSENNEKLREASAVGDLHAVKILLKAGVADVNSQNRINKWTALHWASKRNNIEIVKILVENGAEKLIENDKGQIAVQLTTNDEVRSFLGGMNSMNSMNASIETENKDEKDEYNFVPAYMNDFCRKVDVSDISSEPVIFEPDFTARENLQDKMSEFSNKSKVIYVRVDHPDCDNDYVQIHLQDNVSSFRSFVNSTCREFGISPSDVVKIRKQILGKNVLIGNEDDFNRLEAEPFLDVVLKPSSKPSLPSLKY